MKKKVATCDKGRYSIRSAMIFFTSILMVLFFTVTIATFAFIARVEVRKAIESGNTNTIEQTKKLLDDRLVSMFEQTVALANSYNLMNIMGQLHNARPFDPMLYVPLNNDLESFYRNNLAMLDSVYLNLNNGKVVYYKGEGTAKNAEIDFKTLFQKYGNTSFHWKNIDNESVIPTVSSANPSAELFYLIGSAESDLNGIIHLRLKDDYFREIFTDSTVYENSYFAIVAPDKSVYYNTSEPQLALDMPLIERISAAEDTAHFTHKLENGKKLYISSDIL